MLIRRAARRRSRARGPFGRERNRPRCPRAGSRGRAGARGAGPRSCSPPGCHHPLEQAIQAELVAGGRVALPVVGASRPCAPPGAPRSASSAAISEVRSARVIAFAGERIVEPGGIAHEQDARSGDAPSHEGERSHRPSAQKAGPGRDARRAGASGPRSCRGRSARGRRPRPGYPGVRGRRPRWPGWASGARCRIAAGGDVHLAVLRSALRHPPSTRGRRTCGARGARGAAPGCGRPGCGGRRPPRRGGRPLLGALPFSISTPATRCPRIGGGDSRSFPYLHSCCRARRGARDRAARGARRSPARAPAVVAAERRAVRGGEGHAAQRMRPQGAHGRLRRPGPRDTPPSPACHITGTDVDLRTNPSRTRPVFQKLAGVHGQAVPHRRHHLPPVR